MLKTSTFILVIMAIVGTALSVIMIIGIIRHIKTDKKQILLLVCPIAISVMTVCSLITKSIRPYTFLGAVGLILIAYSKIKARHR
jgi:hypothetical protein